MTMTRPFSIELGYPQMIAVIKIIQLILIFHYHESERAAVILVKEGSKYDIFKKMPRLNEQWYVKSE